MSAPSPKPSIHRLIDIVVEEVSLVDRAANQRRFLIVKRSVPMSSAQATDNQSQNTVDETAPEDQGTPDPSPDNGTDQAGLVDSAVEALERLTDVVEELREIPGSPLPARFQEVTTELRAIAQSLLEVSGNSTASESEEAPDAREPDVLADVLGSVRTILEQIKAGLAERKATEKAQAPGATAAAVPQAAQAELAKSQEAANRAQKDLVDAMGKLTEAVKTQGQRLSHLEKRFGLPNSTPPSERSPKKTEDEVGWPMDLNRPFDRDSVDESVSFHNL